MSVTAYLRHVMRALRGSRGTSALFCLSVAAGVLAVVGVAALAESAEHGLRARSRQFLGGDLALESRRPLPDVDPYLSPAQRTGARVDLAQLSTMVRSASGASRLAELKAIGVSRGRFPLAGTLVLEPKRPLEALLHDDAVLVAPALRDALKLKIGDSLAIGEATLRVAGFVLAEPDVVGPTISFGPRVLLTRAALERTGLLGFGSRIRYRTLLRFDPRTPASEIMALRASLTQHFPGGGSYVTIESHLEGQPGLRKVFEQVHAYLGLVALSSLLIASVGFALLVSAWLTRGVKRTAILRCLGLRPRAVVARELGHLAVLALIGSLLGGLLGSLLPAVLGVVHPQLTLVQGGPLLLPGALVRGVGLGVGLPLALSLPSLTQVFQVSPLTALRSAAVPLVVPKRVRLFSATAALVGLLLAAWLQARDLTIALAYAAGILALAALSFLAARSFVGWIGRRPRARLPALVWYGAAGLARPSAQTTGSIVALGLGASLVLSIALLQELLARELEGALPHDAPSVFLVDVQPDQWPSVAALARALGATRVDSAPVVMARLAALDGRPVAALLAERPGDRNARERAHRLLTREQRISWMAQLPPDNQIVAGALWRDPQIDEVSLEQDFARDLGARVGSVLTFDVQGVPLDFMVTSLRSVRWRSFATNFFIVAEPGPLDDAPHFRLGALRLPRDAEQTLQDRLAALYPNVTVLRVHDLMAQVRALVAQSGLLVRLLGGLAMLTGVLVLVFGVAATQQRRAREAALLKALGASPRAVVAMFAIEYGLVGATAGALASVGAYALTAALARYVLAFSSWPAPGHAALACGATVGLTVLGGLLASARALRVRPLAVLRQRG